MKVCKKCNKEKEEEEFGYRKQNGVFYINSYCRECMKEYLKQYKKTYKDKYRYNKREGIENERM